MENIILYLIRSEALNGRVYTQDQFVKAFENMDNMILHLIRSDALKGKFYTKNEFIEEFEDKENTEDELSVRISIESLLHKRKIQFFNNAKDYGLPAHYHDKLLMCVKDMEVFIAKE